MRPDLGEPGSVPPRVRPAYMSSGAPIGTRQTSIREVLRDKVRSILTWHDPMDIGAIGGDYNAEAERILGALEYVRTEVEVALLVGSVFEEMFRPAKPSAAYAEVAKDIWQAYRSV
jgi:hypothetical protein